MLFFVIIIFVLDFSSIQKLNTKIFHKKNTKIFSKTKYFTRLCLNLALYQIITCFIKILTFFINAIFVIIILVGAGPLGPDVLQFLVI